MIESGKAAGAKMLCGGHRHGDKGYFVENTIFTDVTRDMKIVKEEVVSCASFIHHLPFAFITFTSV